MIHLCADNRCYIVLLCGMVENKGRRHGTWIRARILSFIAMQALSESAMFAGTPRLEDGREGGKGVRRCPFKQAVFQNFTY